jgi:hypothetical protein
LATRQTPVGLASVTSSRLGFSYRGGIRPPVHFDEKRASRTTGSLYSKPWDLGPSYGRKFYMENQTVAVLFQLTLLERPQSPDQTTCTVQFRVSFSQCRGSNRRCDPLCVAVLV